MPILWSRREILFDVADILVVRAPSNVIDSEGRQKGGIEGSTNFRQQARSCGLPGRGLQSVVDLQNKAGNADASSSLSDKHVTVCDNEVLQMSNLPAKLLTEPRTKVKLNDTDLRYSVFNLHGADLSKLQPPVERAIPTRFVDFREEFVVDSGNKIKLGEVDPSYHSGYESREAALPETALILRKLDRLQCLMYAERKHSLLIVLQGLDASGKDGVIRHILNGMNPAGCRVVGFKQPKTDELAHDFLWRVHPHLPAKGEVSIFNRSHYEDVLVVRVHKFAQVSMWSKRYDLINDFERLLKTENNTTLLKFLLYISKEEQLVRFRQRLEDRSQRWKISESDYEERAYWSRYVDAFEDMLYNTSTPNAPWFVIPSNHKWFRDLAVSQIVSRTLEDLEMKMPEPAVDIDEIFRRYHAAEVEADAFCVSRERIG